MMRLRALVVMLFIVCQEPAPHSPFEAAPPVGYQLSVALGDFAVYVDNLHEVN